MTPRLADFGLKRYTALVPLTAIRTTGDNSRMAAGDVSELAQSIKSVGVLMPVVLSGTQQPYRLVCGTRRVAAARLVGLESVPAILLQLGTRETQIASLIENVQRQDLTAIEEAFAFERLCDDMTQREVAALIGKSQPYVSNTLRLLKLPKAVRAQIASGKLTRAAALAVLMQPESEREAVATQVVEHKMPSKTVERIGKPRRLPRVHEAVGTLYELRVRVLGEPQLLRLVDRALSELGEANPQERTA